jgi:multidrug efflux pump
MPVSALPQVDFPIIEITTQLPGANPDTIASIVTASLEREFGHIPSLVAMSSQSSYGWSRIALQFELDRDIDAAAQDVQSAINAAGSTLPRNLPYPPVYRKVNPADVPILTLAISSDNVPLRKLADLADTQIGPHLAQIPGVGRVALEGGGRPAVRIQADLSRLAAYGLGLEDVRAAIVRANVAGAKGLLEGETQSHTIAANDQIDKIDDYENIVIDYRNARPILLRDIAKVAEGFENSRLAGWYRGHPAVILNIQKQPGANIIATVDHILADMPRLKRLTPAGATVEVVFDRTKTIRASIDEVKHTLIAATLLVDLVVLIFLRTISATIIAAISLPLSLVGTFSVMAFFGFSIDNLSLMALTIATGFVIDDSIVMIENIVRKAEDGASPMQAALEGAREIGFTVVSLTVSLIAVFIPLLFMTGLVGRMFREFAMTLAIAVVISALVSLTLTPMLCAKLLRSPSRQKANILIRLAEGPTAAMLRGYAVTLDWALRFQGLMLLISAGALILTIGMYLIVPKGFLPLQDTSVLDATIDVAPQTSFAELTIKQGQVADAIGKDPRVIGVVSILGVGSVNATTNSGRISILLQPKDLRKEGAVEIAERLRQVAGTIPGVEISIKPVQDIQIASRLSRAQYQYSLTGVEPDEVSQWSKRLTQSLADNDVFRHVRLETMDGGLRTFVSINRETAGRLGLKVQTIQDNLNDAFSQRQVSTIYAQANQYRVILEADPSYAEHPEMLSKFYVSPEGGRPIPLNSFAQFSRTTAPLLIAREQQFPAAAISFDLAPNASLGEAVKAIAAAEKEIGLPAQVLGSFSGDADEFQQSLVNLPWLILAAVVSIYIVLGVLYESFAHPFTILTTLPTAGVGAFAALMLTGQSLSIIAVIGIILLMGIVKKNAIMMIDFALQAQRNDGLSPREAIIRACHLRFRPIMMTTIAALLGALPLAFAQGAGSELRTPLGITIIGGLILSQILTLYTTPAIYLAVSRLQSVAGGLTNIPPRTTVRLRDAGGE